MPEPEQVALDRVHARLQPIIPGRRTAARSTSSTQQRRHDEPARLGRDRRASPADTSDVALDDEADARSSGTASARRRQHRTRHDRRRADARGAAEPADRSRADGLSRRTTTQPLGEGLAIRPPGGYSSAQAFMWAPRGAGVASKPQRKTGPAPGLSRSAAGRTAGRGSGRTRPPTSTAGRRRRAEASGNRLGVESGDCAPAEREPLARVSCSHGAQQAPDGEQLAPHLLPTRPWTPAQCGFSVRASSHPSGHRSCCKRREFAVVRSEWNQWRRGESNPQLRHAKPTCSR